MAWRCSVSLDIPASRKLYRVHKSTTNIGLLDNLRSAGIIESDRVYQAMKGVDRGNYVPIRKYAYEDAPQGIGFGATISAPHMHATACEHLLPFLKPGGKVLDVGCGSGYLLGIFHNLVSPGGTVVGIEHIQELASMSENNLKKDDKMFDSTTMKIVKGDGRKGWAEDAPFDAIHVGAAAPTMPEALVEQLARPGRMFIPVGSYAQEILQVDKDEQGNVKTTSLMGVQYVPLTDAAAQYKA